MTPYIVIFAAKHISPVLTSNSFSFCTRGVNRKVSISMANGGCHDQTSKHIEQIYYTLKESTCHNLQAKNYLNYMKILDATVTIRVHSHLHYKVAQKQGYWPLIQSNTCHFTVTLALRNADSSFKLPPLYNQLKICNNTVIKDPITSCCYTTL